MEDFYRCLCTNRMLPLICSMLWITSYVEGTNISATVGSRVLLPCNVSKSIQIKWSRNGVHLITYNQDYGLYFSEDAKRQKVNMSLSERDLYTLVIDCMQEFNTGIYECESSALSGVTRQVWTVTITKNHGAVTWEKLLPVAVLVICICLLIFILSFALLRRFHKRDSEQSIHARNTAMCSEQTLDIPMYENSLSFNRRHPSHYQQRHHQPRCQH